jgi:endonuclease YncB( thermonuclease family)
MNKILCAFLCVFFCGVAHAVPAVVDYVLDGDTFAAAVKLEDDISITVRVRLINVDTPELSGECDKEIQLANRAKEYTKALLPSGTRVELKNIKDDKYLGRIDANVILSDGRDVGDLLVNKKLARRYNGGRQASWCK